jgi:nitroreductase
MTPFLTEPKLLEAFHQRYATKKFDAAKIIPEATWSTLEQTLLLSPSSFGLQPWKFIVVRDPTLRKELLAASWNQQQVADASHFVVFTVRTAIDEAYIDRNIALLAETRGIPAASLKGLRDMIAGFVKSMSPADVTHWNIRQVYIALGNLMTAAALLGIDSCPMEGIDPKAYDRILGLEGTGYSTVVTCPVGYRADDDKYGGQAKVRFPIAEIIEHR